MLQPHLLSLSDLVKVAQLAHKDFKEPKVSKELLLLKVHKGFQELLYLVQMLYLKVLITCILEQIELLTSTPKASQVTHG
jgi:hypothetical protein